MTNSKNIEIEELSSDGLKKVEGGVIGLVFAGIGLIIGAYTAGYMIGKAIFSNF